MMACRVPQLRGNDVCCPRAQMVGTGYAPLLTRQVPPTLRAGTRALAVSDSGLLLPLTSIRPCAVPLGAHSREEYPQAR